MVGERTERGRKGKNGEDFRGKYKSSISTAPWQFGGSTFVTACWCKAPARESRTWGSARPYILSIFNEIYTTFVSGHSQHGPIPRPERGFRRIIRNHFAPIPDAGRIRRDSSTVIGWQSRRPESVNQSKSSAVQGKLILRGWSQGEHWMKDQPSDD